MEDRRIDLYSNTLHDVYRLLQSQSSPNRTRTRSSSRKLHLRRSPTRKIKRRRQQLLRLITPIRRIRPKDSQSRDPLQRNSIQGSAPEDETEIARRKIQMEDGRRIDGSITSFTSFSYQGPFLFLIENMGVFCQSGCECTFLEKQLRWVSKFMVLVRSV
jgi:hypothetical protein